MIRTPQALLPYLLALAVVLGGWLWHLGDTLDASGRAVEQGVADIGGPFALTDQTGAVRRDTDFRGRLMLIYFGFSNCPDVCPTTLAVMADALDQLGTKADGIVPIFITVDPARDTPEILSIYMKAFGPQFVGLTGDAAAIAAVEKEYHVFTTRRVLPGGGYTMDHSSVLYLMGPDGKYLRHWDEAILPDQLARDLEKIF